MHFKVTFFADKRLLMFRPLSSISTVLDQSKLSYVLTLKNCSDLETVRLYQLISSGKNSIVCSKLGGKCDTFARCH